LLGSCAYGELVYGIEKQRAGPESWRVLQELMQMIQVVPLSSEAAQICGAIRAELAARGQLIGANDLWIAAHAKAMDLTLVTNNEREFRRIPQLKLENWVE